MLGMREEAGACRVEDSRIGRGRQTGAQLPSKCKGPTHPPLRPTDDATQVTWNSVVVASGKRGGSRTSGIVRASALGVLRRLRLRLRLQLTVRTGRFWRMAGELGGREECGWM